MTRSITNLTPFVFVRAEEKGDGTILRLDSNVATTPLTGTLLEEIIIKLVNIFNNYHDDEKLRLVFEDKKRDIQDKFSQ